MLMPRAGWRDPTEAKPCFTSTPALTVPLAAGSTVTPFALQAQQKPPWVLHQDNWGCLSSQIQASFFF